MPKAKQTTAENVNEVVTIETKVKGVRLTTIDDKLRYRVDFDKLFKGYTKQDDEFIETDVSWINFIPRVLIAQVLSLVEGVDIMYTKKQEKAVRTGDENGFGAAELNVILRNSKIVLERKKFLAGEEYTDSDGNTGTYDHDGYHTDITKIVVTDRIQKKLDELIDSMFEL